MQNTISVASILPTSLELMRDRRTLLQSPFLRFLVEKLLQILARRIVTGKARGKLHFSIVNSPKKWRQIRQLRLETYKNKLPYMLEVINPDGSDEYDARSVVFGIWYEDRAVATLRFTSGSFEISQYLSPSILQLALPHERAGNTLELSRLIAQNDTPFKRLMPALITFTGLSICLFTDFDHYIGYSKPQVFKKFNSFMCSAKLPKFKIPERGEHLYEIVEGSFRSDLSSMIQEKIKPSFLAKMIERVLRKIV